MSIKVEKLTKKYGSQAAVDDISFEIKTGEIVGFLGPNGAGKTTTLKMITSYLPPTEGDIFVEGINVQLNSLDVRKKLGYLPEQNPLYGDMNVIDFLVFAARLQSMPENEIKPAVEKMVKVCGLTDVRKKDINELSKGYKQRVGLAQAMIHNPDVILLDEPTSGLDPNQIIEIRNLIKEIGKKKTVMLSTHILQEVQATCDRVIIINKGKIVADATPDSLQKQFEDKIVTRVVIKATENVNVSKINESVKSIRKIEKFDAFQDIESGNWIVDVTTEKGVDIREEMLKKVISSGYELLELKQKETSLEDIFRKLTKV